MNLISLNDLEDGQLPALLDQALVMKRGDDSQAAGSLAGKLLALLFEKPSTRTRLSFEAAMRQLGGSCVFVDTGGRPVQEREPICDLARIYSAYCDGVVLRTHEHETIAAMGRHASIPVINGLSDHVHPCQVLADLLTIQEIFGACEGVTVAYVGDGNNVARSLAYGCAQVGAHLRVASPSGYRLTDEFLETVRPPGVVERFDTPAEAVRGAQAVYTDVWTSMGQEEEAARRRQDFAAFQVTTELMSQAEAGAVFMHCLPAHRGQEVQAEVLDGPQSVVFQQAANRLHAQKAVLRLLLGSAE